MKLLNIEYDNLTVHEALAAIFQLIENKSKSQVFFLNADCLSKAQKDREYQTILSNADLVLPDGIGIKLATRLFGGHMREDCNGTDLSPKIIEQAANKGLRMFFLGGKEGIAQKAALNVQKQLPSVKIVGAASGYFKDTTEIISQINSQKPDILFVALGVPIQEKWISHNLPQLDVKLCLGVGAFLDYLSGTLPRAPQWMRTLHLEWLWRIFIDPKRMFKRYIIDGFCFIIYMVGQKIKGANKHT